MKNKTQFDHNIKKIKRQREAQRLKEEQRAWDKDFFPFIGKKNIY